MQRLQDNAYTVPLLLGALTLVGAALRLDVAGQDLFADELATYWVVSRHDLPGVVETVSSTAEITPPLSFILSWLSTRIDLTPEMLRLPALIAGIGSIPLVYAVGLRTVGRSAALLAAALATFGPFMIFYSAEARGYAVLIALLLLSTLALLVAVDDGRRRWWAAYAIFACLAAYTHYTSVFVLAAQFGWALWAHPAARRPLLLATATAALIYLPWLPSLKGDLDSPTTEILSALSPFDLESVKQSLGHWTIGFPFAWVATMRELPGTAALIMIGVGSGLVGAGVLSERRQLPGWLGANSAGAALVLILALATPLGEAVVSAVGTNVFSTRNLAGSWPYLALAGAGLLTLARPPLRWVAGALVLAGFVLGGVKMAGSDHARPDYTGVASFAAQYPGGVVVDGAAFTPGPLANFDVEGSEPPVPVFRLNLPEQDQEPFDIADRLPEPADLARRVVAAAQGGPITIVTTVSENPIAGGRARNITLAARFIEALPSRYRLIETRRLDGFLRLQAEVYAPSEALPG